MATIVQLKHWDEQEEVNLHFVVSLAYVTFLSSSSLPLTPLS
jgi:hypothetical protein